MNGTTGIPKGSSSHSLETSAPAEKFHKQLIIYISVGLGVGLAVCVAVIIFIVLYRRGKFRRFGKRRESLRRLFVRGFSTISQRGVVDSTAEFEMVNTSVSSECSVRSPGSAKDVPKKPERRRTRTSSNNVRYENVTLDSSAGFVVRKSISMGSGIPYIDSTLDSHIKDDDDDEDLDDVFK